jgi:hypothetical protein
MRVPKRGEGAGRPVVAGKSGKPDGAKGSRHPARNGGQPRKRKEPSGQASRPPGEVGHAEIQEAATASPTSGALARQHCSS